MFGIEDSLLMEPSEGGGGGGGFLNVDPEDGERDGGGAPRLREDAEEVVALDADLPNDEPAPGLRLRLV